MRREWNHDPSLDWHLGESAAERAGWMRFLADLGAVYRERSGVVAGRPGPRRVPLARRRRPRPLGLCLPAPRRRRGDRWCCSTSRRCRAPTIGRARRWPAGIACCFRATTRKYGGSGFGLVERARDRARSSGSTSPLSFRVGLPPLGAVLLTHQTAVTLRPRCRPAGRRQHEASASGRRSRGHGRGCGSRAAERRRHLPARPAGPTACTSGILQDVARGQRLQLSSRRRARPTGSGEPLAAARRPRPDAGSSIPAPSAGPMPAGAGSRWRTSSSTSCTSEPSARGGTFDGVHRAAAGASRPGRDRDRAHAGRGIPRQPQLGLRRGLALCARRAPTAGRTGCGAWWTRPIGSASPYSSTWCTTISGRRGTTSASSAPTSRTGTAPPGARASTSTARTATRSAAMSWTTRCTGSTEYHLDGLRLDAVDRIVDRSPVHIVEELGAAVHAQGEALGRRTARHRRDRRQRSPVGDARARWAATDWTRIGRTTSTTRCTSRSPARGRATTPTSAAWRRSPKCSRGATSTTAATRATDGGGTGGPRRTCPPTGSSSRSRITTRSATAPRGERLGDAALGRRRCGWPRLCCCSRPTCRCSSWARSTARPIRSSTS